MMANSSPAPRLPKGSVSTSYTAIRQFEPDRHGNFITLCVGVNRQDRRTYAILFNCRPDAVDRFDIVMEVEATEETHEAMVFAADVANWTLKKAALYNDPDALDPDYEPTAA